MLNFLFFFSTISVESSNSKTEHMYIFLPVSSNGENHTDYVKIVSGKKNNFSPLILHIFPIFTVKLCKSPLSGDTCYRIQICTAFKF